MLDALVFTMAVMSGPKPPAATEKSTYSGAYFDWRSEGTRQCIAQRESNGRREAVNSTGKFQGPYQMSADLVVGATWMMLPELKRFFGPALGREVASDLRGIPMQKWDPWLQDLAFWRVWNFGAGAKHWTGHGQRWACAPRMSVWAQ